MPASPTLKVDHPWQALVAFKCRLIEQNLVNQWTWDYLLKEPCEPVKYLVFDLQDLIRTRTDIDSEIESLLTRIVSLADPEFDIRAGAVEEFAKSLWLERLQAYSTGEFPPWFICSIVFWIEDTFDFPEWLGNMYNACDWVEETWTRSDAPAVLEEVETLLDKSS